MAFFIINYIATYLQMNPLQDSVYLDIFKMVLGITAWIGGFVYFMWKREKSLKAAQLK